MKLSARHIAAEILLQVATGDGFADHLLDLGLSTHQLERRDRALASELVYGVIRRQGSLDHIIGQFSKIGTSQLEPQVLMLLRLGIYQMFYLDRIPTSAAVNETVTLAGVLVPRAKGFFNAVLRSADRGRQRIVWPAREHNLAGFLAAYYSHPRWLVDMWLTQLGTEEAEIVARAMTEQPPLTVRVNTLKIERQMLATEWKERGIDSEAGIYSPLALRPVISGPPTQLHGFAEGLFTIQDESSQVAAALLDARPGERVLDLCAAPGGKTTALAQMMGNRGEILACDINHRKVRLIEETAARLGVTIISTRTLGSQALPSEYTNAFDRVLVDAPCSGLGVIRRNPEIKWRKQPGDLVRLAAVQRELLARASRYVAPGGTLVYATCSTAAAEDEAIVDDFLSRHPHFMLENAGELYPALADLFTERGMLRSWPHRHHGVDGFFAARMKRLNQGACP